MTPPQLVPPICTDCRHCVRPVMGLSPHPECWHPKVPRNVATGSHPFTVHVRERTPREWALEPHKRTDARGLCGPQGELFEPMPQFVSRLDRFLYRLGWK
jgi:hypothetical protein